MQGVCSDPIKEAEHRRKISGENNPAKRPEVRAKLRAAGCGRYERTPEIRAKASRTKLGTINPSMRLWYQTEAGLLEKRKLSFLRKGSTYLRVSPWGSSWRKLVWWLFLKLGKEELLCSRRLRNENPLV